MLGLLSASCLLSLLSVVSSTSEYPKRAEGWYPSSDTVSSASRGVRDRRTTHWESRSHSNLDDDRRRADDDRDGGHGQHSYPLLVDQSSPLGSIPTARVELSASQSTNQIDFSDEGSLDTDSRLDHCVTISRNPVFLLSIDNTRRGDVKELQLSPSSSGRFATIRCRRRIQGWTLQEPVYVEEPRWVIIDLNHEMGSGHSLGDDDPFYVARGKRSARLSTNDRAPENKNSNDLTDLSMLDKNDVSENQEKNQRTVQRRRKRDALGDVLLSSLAGGQEPGYGGRLPGVGAFRGNGHAHGYVSPRDKHSEILDILNEPFFISRGKKDSMRLRRRYEWINRYAKKQILGGRLLPIAETGETSANLCDPRSNDCFVGSLGIENEVPASVDDPFAMRDRRGVVEDILKEGDPFYLARGKRSSASKVARRFHDDSDYSYELVTGASSNGLSNDRTTATTSPTISRFTTESISNDLSMVH